MNILHEVVNVLHVGALRASFMSFLYFINLLKYFKYDLKEDFPFSLK